MDLATKERLARLGDTSGGAIAQRLRAARAANGYSQKSFAEAVGLGQTTYNSQEVKGAPSLDVMRFLYRAHRVDFNFILHGDFGQLPGDVQAALFAALLSAATSGDPEPSSR